MERSVEVLAIILFGVMMARVPVERSWEFQVAGAALVVLVGLLG